jgi:hypothetical protein
MIHLSRYASLVLSVRSEGANGFPGPPDLLVVDFSQLPGEIFTVSRPAIELEGLAGFRSVLHALVELLEDGGVSLLENGGPVESTTAGSGGASVVHVVHANQMSQCPVNAD